MKILIPSYDFKPMLGGVANYVHEVASLLATEHGAQVTVLARNLSGTEEFDSQTPYKVIRLPSAQSAFASQLTFSIRMLGTSKNFDKILCPLWFPDATSAWWAQKLSLNSVPTYVVAHASELFKIQKDLKTRVRHVLVSPLQRPVLTNAKGIFAVSNFTGSLLCDSLNIAREKIHVINNGVNLKLFSTPKTKSHSAKLRLLTVTRLLPYKGIDVVLKSLALLKKDTPQFHYTIVGSGPDRARLEALAHSLKLTEHTTFTGPLEKHDILQLYQSSDLFVMMSRYEHPDVEGFGLVFLEAAACGLPSIGGNSGGIPDALDNGQTGWLMDPQNENALCEKIHHLIKNPQELDLMGKKTLSAVQNKDWKHTVQKMWDVLK